MRTSNETSAAEGKPSSINPGFAATQLAKALLASEQHADPALAERAQRRVTDWQAILSNILTGDVQYGSRTPLPDTPAWATLEVATGGFATGNLLAGGPLETFERELLARLGIPDDEAPRLKLNAYFLGEAGMGELLSHLDSGNYSVRVPEEGALLTVAWLTRQGHGEAAREILSAIAPYFATLRFYPAPAHRAHRFAVAVHVRDVAETRAQLRLIAPHADILAQRTAAHSWAPLYDRMLALFAEAMADEGWPGQGHHPDWLARATALLAEFDAQAARSGLPSKYRKHGNHHAQLLNYLRRCTLPHKTLTPQDIERIRHILQCSMAKRGHPLSAQNEAIRQQQRAYVAAPLHAEIAAIAGQRLAALPQSDGIDNPEAFMDEVTENEATASVPAGTAIPASLKRKIERSLNDSVETLVRRGLISSGETMAKVLPQLTAGLHGLGIEDRSLRQLYSAVYLAFRRRRSLLLLNLESQVRIEELPWVSAIDQFRSKNMAEAAASRQALEQIVLLALEFFPQAILPNRLISELDALASRAALDIPLVEELATDIFMGQFAPKFSHATTLACKLLSGSLYAAYYQIDTAQIVSLLDAASARRGWRTLDEFAQLCASRAGVTIGSGRPAINGMIVEQQQILTTQNLAALIGGLDLQAALQDRLAGMAQTCFKWICSRNQMQVNDWHARLILVKNSAYAWRQMIFFLSLLPKEELQAFLDWADQHYGQQSPAFQSRFRPAFEGLRTVATTLLANPASTPPNPVQPFLGWSDGRHWLMEAKA